MLVSWHELLDITSASRIGSRQAMIHRLLTLPVVLLCLAACQSGALPRPGETLFEQLSGGQFTLHRDITIAPGRVRIIFQAGTAGYGASEYKPRCELEVRDILATPQTIPAGSYRIGKVRGMQRYVGRPAENIMLAAVGDAIRLADDTSNEWYMYTYRMQLLNEQQVDAAMLVCGGAYNFAFYARYPTLQEMRDSLGDYATLSLD
jgi:hypothetical protein